MKLISRFIVWYLKRHNVCVEHNGYVVRMYTKEYYEEVILETERTHRGKTNIVHIQGVMNALARQLQMMAEDVE